MNAIRTFITILFFTLCFDLTAHEPQAEAEAVMQSAQDEIAHLEKKLNTKIERLYAKSTQESESVKLRDSKKALKIMHRAQNQEDHLRREFEREKERILKDAQKKAKHYLKITELEQNKNDLLVANEKKVQVQVDETPSPVAPEVQPTSAMPAVLITGERTPISDDWKKQVTHVFEGNVSYLKGIILEGETDYKEQQSFNQLFGAQKNWFDATVSSTTFFFDPSYNAVMKKQQSIDELAQAQEKADSLIVKLAAPTVLPNDILKRLRVVVLYEINAAYRKIEKEQQSKMSDTQIEDLIKKVLSQAHIVESNETAQAPVESPIIQATPEVGEHTFMAPAAMPTPIVAIPAQKEPVAQQLVNKDETSQFLKNRLEQLQNELKEQREKMEKETRSLRDELQRAKSDAQIEMKKIIEKKNEESLQLEVQLKKAQQNVDGLTKRLEKSTQEFNRIKSELANTKKHQAGQAEKLKELLEESNKKQISLQLMIDRAQGKVNSLKQKLGLNEEKLNKLKTDYQKDIENQKAQGTRLEISLRTARDEITQLKQRIELLVTQRENAQQMAEKAFVQVKELSAQNQSLSGQNSEDKRKRRAAIELALSKLAEQNENLKQVMFSQKDEVKQLRSQIQSKINELGQDIQGQFSHLAGQQQTLMQLKQEQAAKEAENVQGMQDSLMMLADRFVRSDQETKELHEKQMAMQNENVEGFQDSLMMLAEQSVKSEQAVNDLQEKQQAMQNENVQGMQDSLMMLAEQLVKFEQTADELSQKQMQMQSVVDKTKDNMSSLQDKIDKNNEKIDQLADQSRKNFELAFKSARREIEGTKQKIELLLTEREQARKTSQEALAEMEKLSQEYEKNAKAKRKKRKQKEAEIEARNAQIKEQSEQFKQLMESQKTELGYLRKELQSTAITLENSFQNQVAQLQQRESSERAKGKEELIQASQETKDAIKQELKDLASQLSKYENETAQVAKQQSSLQQKIDKGEKSTYALQEKIVANDQQIALMQTNQKYEREKQQQLRSQFQASLNNAQEELVRLRTKIESLNDQSDQARQKSLQALEEVRELTERNEMMKDQIEDEATKMKREKEFKDAYSQLMKQNDQYKQLAQSQKGEIEQLRAQISSKVNDLEQRFKEELRQSQTKEAQDIQRVEQQEHIVAQKEAKDVLQQELKELSQSLAQHAVDASHFQQEMEGHQQVYEQLSKDLEEEAERLEKEPEVPAPAHVYKVTDSEIEELLAPAPIKPQLTKKERKKLEKQKKKEMRKKAKQAKK